MLSWRSGHTHLILLSSKNLRASSKLTNISVAKLPHHLLASHAILSDSCRITFLRSIRAAIHTEKLTYQPLLNTWVAFIFHRIRSDWKSHTTTWNGTRKVCHARYLRSFPQTIQRNSIPLSEVIRSSRESFSQIQKTAISSSLSRIYWRTLSHGYTCPHVPHHTNATTVFFIATIIAGNSKFIIKN